MDVQKLETLPPPPGVFNSLRAGFDVVTNRVVLILIPLCLDVFLWLGPRLSVNELLAPYSGTLLDQARRGVTASDLEAFMRTQELFMERLQNFNLLSFLSRMWFSPIGIPSLAAQTQPVSTPFGTQVVVNISSVWVMFGLAFILIPLGWIFGGVYFRQVAGSTWSVDEAGIGYMRAVAQSLLLSILWLIGLMIVLVPVSMMLTLLMIISPALANIAVIVFLFLMFWLVVPLFFTPHGIFMRRENAFYSIYSSLRMVRFTLPTSGLFVLSAFILANGLSILWSVPQSDSWLTLVGFAGHAFVSTVVLAASFVYYRDMNGWLNTVYERFRPIGRGPTSSPLN
jgi:hypothetical protein